jgi:Ca2+-transporting ATPase
MNDAKFRGGTPGAPRAGLARGGRPAADGSKPYHTVGVGAGRPGVGAPSPGGLDEAGVARSRALYGPNVLSKRKKKSFFLRFLKNMWDPVTRILIAALAINIIVKLRGGDWVECVGIAVTVLVATFISTMSEYGGETAFEKLSATAGQEYCRVRRGGKTKNIKTADVVVGDIVLLSPGDKVPADGLIINGAVFVNQAVMTGENREVEKKPSSDRRVDPAAPSAVLRGCAVMSGEGEAWVLAVGDSTFLGEISREVQEEKRDSPLKLRLAKLAGQISRLGYFMAALVAAIYLFDTLIMDSGSRYEIILHKLADWRFVGASLLHALTLALTVIVVAVPEGLPMMIAVVLSANMRRMVRDNVLVRKPVGIEAAGSMNILFADKTGTLTEGRLSVGEIHAGDGTKFSGAGDLRKRSGFLYSRFCLMAHFNNSASFEGGRPSGGNSTDRALLAAVAGHKPVGWRTLRRLPFDSAHKYSAVQIVGEEKLTLIKGAPELLLPYIRRTYLPDGSLAPADTRSILELIKKLSSAGNRVILLAEGTGGLHMQKYGALTLICLVILDDKLRREAAASVSGLRDAGIHVVMITGDNRETAAYIASRCGILGDGVDLCIDGREFAGMSDMKLKEILPRLGVLARALPSDKSRLVRVAQELGLVVGMTGDGINDAPALKRADIGFSMGCGTQVAKEAGDIIILDNNLASISKAVLYGRSIFKNIRKFITLQLTMNFCAVGVSMIGPFIGVDAPVTVVQMLWINLVMDTLGGLAFAGEPALTSYMKEKPKRRDEPILNGYMINTIVFLGGFTVALCIAFLKMPFIVSRFRVTPDNLCHMTAFFALFIFSSVFNCFNARTDRLRLLSGIGNNRTFIFIVLSVLTVQLVFVYLGGSLLRTMPLLPSEMLTTMLVSLLVFPAEFARKLLWRALVGKEGY